ncbi:unnamed protein product [Anisakis simplex]|uniref:Uncharacterized protein n=1 Tax=Anisakis simplex TaxID=6269 RepID=A0A0M3JB05_ANISI|nr:unnamed protein product [Anisakis simplex]
MILRDLYEVSRSIANDEFNNKIDLLSAYLLPLMITCGFTEQLTPDELIRLEYQYTFNIKHEQNSHSKDVDCKRHELALKLFQEVSSKLFSNAETNESEYYEIGELLDEYLLKQQKKKQSFKTGNINSNIAQNSAKISHPKTLSVSEKNSNTNRSKSNNGNGQLTDLIKPTSEGSCDSQASSPIGNIKDKIKVIASLTFFMSISGEERC